MVILLIKQISGARRPHHVVDAVSDFAVAGPRGMSVFGARSRVRESIAAIPSLAAILRRKDAGRRNSDPEFFGIRRISQNRMQDQSGCAGIPTAGGRMIAQALNFLPSLAAIAASKQPCRFGPGIERPVGITQRPNLRELVGERQRLLAPIHHGGELRIVRRPVVNLPLGKLGDLPRCARVFRAPHTGAVKIAAAAGPQHARGRVTNDVVDGPAVAEWPFDRPALLVAAAGNQERTFRRADEYRQPHLGSLPLFSGS